MATLICLYFFKNLYLEPNTYAPTYGGDGLIIHYNLLYHSLWGEGAHLTSMHHPHGEVLYMTDGHGMFAYIIAKLRGVFPGVTYFAIGITNFIMYWSNPLSAFLLCLVLLKLRVRPWVSVLFGVGLALLSPQIIRQNGHYALGFSFIIPLIIHYLLQDDFNKKHVFYSFGLLLTLLFFGFNNPYLLIISTSFLLASFGFGLLIKVLFKHEISYKILLSWLAILVSSLLIFKLVVHQIDLGYVDRTRFQPGFLTSLSTWSEMIYPPETWLHSKISPYTSFTKFTFEGRVYLGLVSIGVLFVSPIVLLINRSFIKRILVRNHLSILLLAAISILIFSFGIPFSYYRDFSINNLGELLQLRSPTRFSWIFYYVWGIFSVIFISQLLDLRSKKIEWLAYSIVLLLLLGVSKDVYDYLSWNSRGKIHKSWFNEHNLKKYDKVIAEAGIDASDYQGIFVLPTINGWTIKVMQKGLWRSKVDSYAISLRTGLPLINGKLSRASISHSLAALQMVSNNLIKKPILEETLDPDKAILFVSPKSSKYKPTKDERYLLSLMDTIYSDKDRTLYRAMPRVLSQAMSGMRHRVLNDYNLEDRAYIYNHFNEDNSVGGFGNENGALVLGGGESIIHQQEITVEQRDSLELSIWNFVDQDFPGGPYVKLTVLEKGVKVLHQQYYAQDQIDTQNGWLRFSFDFLLEPGSYEVLVSGKFKYQYKMDELLLRSHRDTIYYKHGADILFNNFVIDP